MKVIIYDITVHARSSGDEVKIEKYRLLELRRLRKIYFSSRKTRFPFLEKPGKILLFVREYMPWFGMNKNSRENSYTVEKKEKITFFL
jgi:hypothetical protein